jgi:hypothetical protein
MKQPIISKTRNNAKITPDKAVRERCLDCSGFSPQKIKVCWAKDCQLYPFRDGKCKRNLKTIGEAIKQYCRQHCMNGQPSEVLKCPSLRCPLHAYRQKREAKMASKN